ncbi:MAG: alpha/beta hydrolase [Clostridia bacterium]|nr:alpha/beta hydrolase [Clostridia bacterium]
MDISLHYTYMGDGFPLLLLHGNGESVSYFKNQMESLSRHARVIAVDTRGHGLSPRGEKPFTLTQFAEDLKDFLDELNIAQTDLLGFSDGGNIALLFAIQHPHRVHRLVLNGANLNPWGVQPIAQTLICALFGFACLLSPFSAKYRAKKEMLGLMVLEPRISPEALSQVTNPTLVIAGTRDIIRMRHTRFIAKALPNAQFCLLKGDHFIASKRPAAFNEVVIRFLYSRAEKSRRLKR